MLARRAKLNLLKQVPLFARCTSEQLGELCEVLSEVELEPGSVLIKEGEDGKRFYVIVEGSVEVRQNGKKLPARGGVGFGEISLFLRRPTTATVTATSPVRALVLTPERFRLLLSESPGFQRRILLSVAERLAPIVD